MTLVVAAAIVDSLDEPTQLLCAQRSYPPDLAGRWELPGGKAEPGEIPEDALQRELREEMGVSITRGRLLPGPSEDSEGDWPILSGLYMRVWFASLSPNSAPPRQGPDHLALRWCNQPELETLDWLKPDLPIILALKNILGGPYLSKP